MLLERRCHCFPVSQQKRPTVMTVNLIFMIWTIYLDRWSPKPSHRPPESLPHQEPTSQHPPSIPKHLSPGQVNQQCAHLYRDPKLHLTHDNQGPEVSGSGHTVQGTEAQATRDTGRTAVCQGEDGTREPTLQEAFSKILGAYQHSQDTMGQILDNVQANKRLQEGQYPGIREDLQAINNTLIAIAVVLADMSYLSAHTTEICPTNSQRSIGERKVTRTDMAN
ncbi:hypothetical protein NDU88_005652 [Pleurodeles waltl]|uniref:Uncharacterized protein n=1 Tax=Pleurodeles waltl TaxID=8319 RepID=A0AAV7RPM0_PLEWA|nr:hypothetical protein NDU88_005652 [Pleurodeles waltl]